MKISTAKLRELVAEALRQDREKWDHEEEEYLAKVQRHREEWLAEFSDQWREAATNILAKVDAGEPIERDDIPQIGTRSWRDPAFYSPPSPGSRHQKQIVAGTAVYQAPKDLVEFQQFLELVQEDTLTTSVLKSHGFHNINQRILHYMDKAIER